MPRLNKSFTSAPPQSRFGTLSGTKTESSLGSCKKQEIFVFQIKVCIQLKSGGFFHLVGKKEENPEQDMSI